jgi:hypothetical protein
MSAAIRLNVSGVITNRGVSIQYIHTDSNHTDPLYRITPAKLLASEDDREKYLEMLLDSVGHYLDLTKRKAVIGGTSFISNVRKTLRQQKRNYNQVKLSEENNHNYQKSLKSVAL